MGTNINSESLNAMQQVDIRTVDKSALIDLNSVKIDESLPIPERVASFVNKTWRKFYARFDSGNVWNMANRVENPA